MQPNVTQLRLGADRHLAPEIHDGQKWLIERPRMTQPAAIIARMAEDIAAMRREYPENPVDLTNKGWTLAQVVRYADVARRSYKDELAGRSSLRQDNRPAPPPEPAVA